MMATKEVPASAASTKLFPDKEIISYRIISPTKSGRPVYLSNRISPDRHQIPKKTYLSHGKCALYLVFLDSLFYSIIIDQII